MLIKTPKAFEKIWVENKYRFKIFYGGRGSAKSYNVALYLLICGLQKKHKFLCCREIQNSIKDSVHSLLVRLINKYKFQDYDVTEREITNLKTGTKFIFRGLLRNHESIKSIDGITKVWIEEASTCSKESLDFLFPTIREENSEIIATFNRFLEHDPIYDKLCRNPDLERTLLSFTTYRDNPFFPEVLRLDMENDKKNDKDHYLWVWEGEPLYQSEDSLLDRKLVQEAMNRKVPDDGGYIVGIDVARFGGDKTEIYRRKGFQVIEHKEYSKLDNYQVADKAQMICGKDDLIKIDATGVGGGVADILRRKRFKAFDINFGASAKDTDKYNMLISEAWFEFKDILPKIGIPNDPELFNQLVNRKWRMDKKGKRCIESKDDYKKRGNKSPDKADALIICFYEYFKYGVFGEQKQEARSFNSSVVLNRIKPKSY